MSSLCRQRPICEDHLYRSLQVAMKDPACALDLDPSKIHCLQNHPLDHLSWVDESGEPCSIVFQAILDLQGDYTALEPYFTLLNDCNDFVCSTSVYILGYISSPFVPKELFAMAVAKTHAVFQLSPLSDIESCGDVPPYAVRRCDMVLDTLSAVYSTTERKIFEGKSQFHSKYSFLILTFKAAESLCEDTCSDPFHCVDDMMGKLFLVVKTHPLFMQYPLLTTYHNWQALPNNHFSQTNSNMIQNVHDPGIFHRHVACLPDPHHLYASLFAGAGMDDCMMNCPNIHDEDGHLILPGEYTKNLKDGMVVLANVSPSL